jgi:hypothetical protein
MGSGAKLGEPIRHGDLNKHSVLISHNILQLAYFAQLDQWAGFADIPGTK